MCVIAEFAHQCRNSAGGGSISRFMERMRQRPVSTSDAQAVAPAQAESQAPARHVFSSAASSPAGTSDVRRQTSQYGARVDNGPTYGHAGPPYWLAVQEAAAGTQLTGAWQGHGPLVVGPKPAMLSVTSPPTPHTPQGAVAASTQLLRTGGAQRSPAGHPLPSVESSLSLPSQGHRNYISRMSFESTASQPTPVGRSAAGSAADAAAASMAHRSQGTPERGHGAQSGPLRNAVSAQTSPDQPSAPAQPARQTTQSTGLHADSRARPGGAPRRQFTIAQGASSRGTGAGTWRTFDGIDSRHVPATSPSMALGALHAGSGMRSLGAMQPHNEVAQAALRPVSATMHAPEATAAPGHAPARGHRPASAAATLQARVHRSANAVHPSAIESGRPSLHSHPVPRGSTATLTSHTHSSPGARSSMASVSSVQPPSHHSPLSQAEHTSPLRSSSMGHGSLQSPQAQSLAEPGVSVALSSPGQPLRRAGVMHSFVSLSMGLCSSELPSFKASMRPGSGTRSAVHSRVASLVSARPHLKRLYVMTAAWHALFDCFLHAGTSEHGGPDACGSVAVAVRHHASDDGALRPRSNLRSATASSLRSAARPQHSEQPQHASAQHGGPSAAAARSRVASNRSPPARSTSVKDRVRHFEQALDGSSAQPGPGQRRRPVSARPWLQGQDRLEQLAAPKHRVPANDEARMRQVHENHQRAEERQLQVSNARSRLLSCGYSACEHL